MQLKYKNKMKSVKTNTEHLLIDPISMKMIDRIHGSMLCQKEEEKEEKKTVIQTNSYAFSISFNRLIHQIQDERKRLVRRIHRSLFFSCLSNESV